MYEMLDKASRDDYIAREMYERRKIILDEASQYVPQPLSEALIDLLIAAHDWDIPEADKFINLLHLEDKDWAALKDDRRTYTDILNQEEYDARSMYYG